MQLHFHLSTQNICQKSAPFPFWIPDIYDRISASTFIRSLTCITRGGARWNTLATGKEEAPCNLAAENRENRKVKMKLQVVKESEVATFYLYVYMYVCMYICALLCTFAKERRKKKWKRNDEKAFVGKIMRDDSSFMKIWQACCVTRLFV